MRSLVVNLLLISGFFLGSGINTSFAYQGICAEALASIQQSSNLPHLYVRQETSRGPQWIRIDKTQTRTVQNADRVEFVLLAPSARSGRAVAKVGIQPEYIISAKKVNLKKNGNGGACENRRRGIIGNFFAYFTGGEAAEFRNGKNVTVREYDGYHRQRAADDPSEIYRFHDSVATRGGACVATDDAESGNRKQFQFRAPDDRAYDRGVRISSLGKNASPPSAVAEPIARSLRKPQNYGLQNFDRLFVHMLVVEPKDSSDQPDFACEPIRVSPLMKGDDVVVQFNRVTYRNRNGDRYREIILRYQSR